MSFVDNYLPNLGPDDADITSHDTYVDGVPHATFTRLRTEDPVHWTEEQDGSGFWSSLRYDDALAVSRDVETFTSSKGIRLEEMVQSLRIIDQVVDRLEEAGPGPVMVDDPKIAWPAQLSIGNDGQGNSRAHINKIMNESMEALIHHFKIFTEGFKVPEGEVYVAVENPRGELGCYLVSDGSPNPVRMHIRGPSFVNLQTLPHLMKDSFLADTVAIISSVDPIMGEVDR